jgi:hypothetical protein
MDRHRSWDDVKRSRPQPSAETRAAIEREVDEELAAEFGPNPTVMVTGDA